jgi:Bacterial SH3 domain.
MKKIVSFGLLFYSLIAFKVFSESVIVEPEIVHTFSVGTLPNQLGRIGGSFANTDAPPISGPQGMRFSSNGNLLILDNINRRLVQYSSDFSVLSSTPVNVWLYQLSLDKGKAIGWYSGDSTLGESFIADLTTNPLSLLKVKSVKLNSPNYSFLGIVETLVIFQYETGELFAVSLGDRSQQLKIVDDQEIKKFLALRRDPPYEVVGEMVIHDGQLISHESRSVFSFFQKQGFATQPFDALANGNYMFSSSDHIWIVGKQARLLIDFGFPAHFEGMIGGPVPSPDGYIYFLDFENADSIQLYRIGQFPELKLDYNGRGGVVNDDNVNLRGASSTRSPAVTKLNKSTQVRILAQTDEPETIGGKTSVWYRVRLWDQTEGWVFGTFLDIKKNE